MPYAAGLAAALTLAGCAVGAAEPAPRATTAVTPAPVTSSAATSSAPTTAAGPTFPAGLPEAAKKQTDDGAKAFVTYFVDQVNKGWRNADGLRIRKLCSREAKSCDGYADLADRLKKGDQRYEGDAIELTTLVRLEESDGVSRVHANVRVLGARVVTKAGIAVRSDQKEAVKNVFYLIWGSSGWAIREVKNA